MTCRNAEQLCCSTTVAPSGKPLASTEPTQSLHVRRGQRLGFNVLAVVALLGCTKQIPNTMVEDTQANRSVVTFMESYRHALEDRDAAAILGMTSERYLDNNGTPKGDDDVDFETLKSRLATFSRIKDARVEMRYRRVSFDGPRVFVEMRYRAMFLVEDGEAEEHWTRAKPTDHRVVLERDKDSDSFKFLSGI